jgi:glutamine cyclotransferase
MQSKWWLIVLYWAWPYACFGQSSPSTNLLTSKVKSYGYEVVNTYPHDAKAFTQGLLFFNGYLYESTGLRGQSSLRQVDLTTGKTIKQYDLEQGFFGEGITLFQQQIVQLTYTSRQGFVYQLDSFKSIKTFSYDSDGWGLTNDGSNLIMTDGSDQLIFLDPTSFAKIRQVTVFDRHGPVEQLNELAFIDGFVFANVWLTDIIMIINPQTGKVVSKIDLTNLLGIKTNSDNPLNGIAFDQQNQRLFVTGKRWPTLFEIKLIPK